MTWTAPDFIDQLTASVAARPGITALTDPTVRVIGYQPSPVENVGDIVVIGFEAEDDNEPETVGNRIHKETVTLRCLAEAIRPGAGPNPAAAARDRAAFLLGEVDAQLRNDYPDVGDQTVAPAPRIASRTMEQFASNREAPVRVCSIIFEVVYTARTSV